MKASQGPDRPASTFAHLANRALLANIATVAGSVVADHIAANPISRANIAMESCDGAFPGVLKLAERAKTRGDELSAMQWRSVVNLGHFAAASYGLASAVDFMNHPQAVPLVVGALNFAVGGWNLWQLRGIRQHKKQLASYHSLTPEPSVPYTIFDRVKHKQHVAARNVDNLEVCIGSNTIESIPALAGPAVDMLWHYGSTSLVLFSSLSIMGLSGRQYAQDVKLAYLSGRYGDE